MQLIRKWERVMAIGCSHGKLANPKAIAAVLKFAEQWKPKHRIHLGDAFDTTCFRSGAKGTSDESSKQDPDTKAGVKFLQQFRPTVFCMGNHEQRLVNLCTHPSEVVSIAANKVLAECLAPVKQLNAKLIPYTVLREGWHELGGYRWGHGHLYGENYLRDSAEAFGNCVVAHAHRAGMQKGRRLDNATAYGVGTLADIPAMHYASGRRATLAWSSGMVFGEVCGDQAQLFLCEWPQGTTDWRLPI